MHNRILVWFRNHYYKIVNSIAFYPALIALGFLLLSYIALEIDFSNFGKSLKARWDIISLKDASTARSIAATIVGGILSLAVFSFSMVMILLSQVASNLSNRVLDSLIGNRFQQLVLGFYIGTIVYALSLLSTIRDIDSGIYIPALSIYLLIFLTVIDIFLFIYFLHYITQSVKYETIINKLHQSTRSALLNSKKITTPEVSDEDFPAISGKAFISEEANYFQGFTEEPLIKLCEEYDWLVSFPNLQGTYLLEGSTYMIVQAQEEIKPEQIKELKVMIDLQPGHSIAKNPFYGFEQLTEIALKALSPGINDPGTAVLSLHALADLFTCQEEFHPHSILKDSKGRVRVLIRRPSFQTLFERHILPIWDYGKNDRILRYELVSMLEQLLIKMKRAEHQVLISRLLQEVRQTSRESTLT